MLTLKLYQNGPLPPDGRTIIIETVGIWMDDIGHGVKHVRAFKKTVGVMDEDGTPEFYVGGDTEAFNKEAGQSRPTGAPQPLILEGGRGGNYFSWGVLENALGKTTEMLR